MLGLEDVSGAGGMGLILVNEVFNLLTHTEENNLQKAVLIPGAVDDATLQLVPCCYRFKMPRFEEQNVNIYIFKSLCIINLSSKNS